MATYKLQHECSPWPHRWAVALVCATFGLIFVGGLVTTTDSGMAVPDWPNTFGYQLFLFPLSEWFSRGWGVFIEHGHRLFGSAVGMLTIALVISLWRSDRRAWIRRLALFALGFVILQGVLGGMRVTQNETGLAMIHGCTGPLFFALTVALAVFTSRRWRESELPIADARAGFMQSLSVAVCVVVYLQIMLGAVVRHVPITAQPSTFLLAVRFHLAMAGIVTLHVALVAWLVVRHFRHVRPLGRLAALLVGLTGVQLALGAATWAVKYSLPPWAASWWPFPTQTTAIVSGGQLQTHVVTLHMAVGSLILATSLSLVLYSLRFLASGRSAKHEVPHRLWEAAR